MSEHALRLIIYTSRLASRERTVDAVLGSIRQQSRARNPAIGVTGVLMFHAGRFLQVLEGEEPHLRELMSRIAVDARHADMLVLVDEPIGRRSLGEWNMETFEVANAALFSQTGLQFVRDALLSNVLPDGAEFVRMLHLLLANRRIVDLIRLRA
ncbi:MAG TPA: BLUF domain-containing protein [Rhodocyclaceae bacterium]|nr:BLUF domain-containing protein [Rhodocyclaceae bacterium]HMV52977.1 BLUF domain-containing protein [Rhodocyclaceae bacterium]HNA02342.1 BLUF domain-containing protein [Rhodocyclaceae bacterium]HNB79292.1 BLUF domain-containing protein [Rhodocyclaceae bacterium]HNC61425.1 BLUF domain-containing protein [Rhodocyclaceae bacterium]